MESLNKTTVILKALDLELKALLMNDLENFKTARSGQKPHQTQQAAWSTYIIIHLPMKEKSSIVNSFFIIHKFEPPGMKSDLNTYFDKRFASLPFYYRFIKN